MEKNQRKKPSATGARQKEGPLNKKVCDWLNNMRNCVCYKRAGGPANPGQLDLSGCLQGIRIELEGKIGNNKPTRLQKHYIAKWKSAGAITGWYNTFEAAKKLVIDQAAEYNIYIED
jgi:hypothetical protein